MADVIMEELIMKGVKGKFLGWIKYHLYGWQVNVWFQVPTLLMGPLRWERLREEPSAQ